MVSREGLESSLAKPEGSQTKKLPMEQIRGESGGARTLDTGLKRPVL